MVEGKQLREMLALQELLEIRINGKDWRKAGHNYDLCIFMECAEIIDHYGWKHWKDLDKQPDLDAVAMEIVDIWHFIMAFVMQEHNGYAKDEQFVYELGKIIDSAEEQFEPGMSMTELCVGMAFGPIAQRQVPFGNLAGMMLLINMDWNQLYELYISKNVLNWFRQENGYKEGTYFKNWGGREDNEHLQELMEDLKKDGNLNAQNLDKALRTRYSLMVAPAQMAE